VRPWCLVVLLSGCGRIGFDGLVPVDGIPGDVTACVQTSHDEDGDGIDDGCDVCPHIADPAQADADGDRVGDVCDPEPAVARQRIVAFDPFVNLAGWMVTSNEVAVGDEAILMGSTGLRRLRRAYAPGNDLFVVSATTGAFGTGSQSILLLSMDSPGPGTYYCELFDDGNTKLQLTYTFDGSSFMHAQSVPAAQSFESGEGTLTVQRDPSKVTCTSRWHQEELVAGGATPQISSDRIVLYAENVDVHVRYFVQIRTE
jgi:hypothetical protein